MKQLFPLQVYPDVTGRFISHRQCMQEFEAVFYHYCLMGYSLNCARYAEAVAHFSGYLNMQ